MTTELSEIQEENKAKVRRLIDEVFSRQNLGVADEIMAPDIKENQRFVPPIPTGPDGSKALSKSLHSMFSDFTFTIEDMVAFGDKVWFRMKARGTNTGKVMGRPPTGKKVEVDVIDIVRFKDGKIVEHWGVPDQLGMLEQLGIIE